jgi:hypothetical protein
MCPRERGSTSENQPERSGVEIGECANRSNDVQVFFYWSNAWEAEDA